MTTATNNSRQGLAAVSPVPIIGGMPSSGSRFSRPLVTSQLSAKTFVLMQPFGYERGEIGSGDLVVVPAGFVSDGMSVPIVIDRLISRYGKGLAGAVLHDRGYWLQLVSRLDEDDLFYEVLVNTGTSKRRAFMIYQGVRSFGWHAWNKNARLRDKNPDARTTDITRPDWWKPYLGQPLVTA